MEETEVIELDGEITELLEFYSLPRKSIHNKMVSFLKENGYDVDDKTDEYIYASPEYIDQHILLTAHMDTINDMRGISEPTKEEFKINRDEHGTWISQKNPDKVLGGDDRNGVYMIKKIIDAGYKPYVVLTHNEETGGAGVRSFLEDYPTKINNLKLAIGIDRGFHNKIKQFDSVKDKLNQVVFYNNGSQDLKNFFFKHGFSQAIGTNSDIKKIGDSYQVPYANISAAYINEHRSYERTCIEDLEHILHICKSIMEENDNLNLTFEYKNV